jgi:hypothetical protein
VQSEQVPEAYAALAQDFMLGRYLKVELEPFGRTRFAFENGAVLEHKGAFAGLVLRDAYSGYRPVQLRKEWVELARRHRLGAFQGCDATDARASFLFEYGAIETSAGAVESLLVRGTRLSGERLMVAPAFPGSLLHAS